MLVKREAVGGYSFRMIRFVSLLSFSAKSIVIVSWAKESISVGYVCVGMRRILFLLHA